MAKVDTIEMNIDGKNHVFNINVGKDGIFKCNIVSNQEVLDKLGLRYNDCSANTLQLLRNTILDKLKSYLEATKIEELFIAILYQANGHYNKTSVGGSLFPSTGSPFNVDTFGRGAGSSLLFDFEITMKETSSTGVVLWKEMTVDEDGKLSTRYESYMRGNTNPPKHSAPLIPYTKEAYSTLLGGREALRKISEMLFNFATQDKEKLISGLGSGKLLETKS